MFTPDRVASQARPLPQPPLDADGAAAASELQRPRPAPALPEPASDGGLGTLRALKDTVHDAAGAIDRALREMARRHAPAPEAPAAARPPAEQAAADAQQVQQAYDSTLARTGNAAQAAAAASAQLEALTSAHAGDRVYTTALLRAAQPTLDRIGSVLGQHVDGRYNGNAADKAAIVATVRQLSAAAGHAGELGALLIAAKLSPHIADRGDLRKLDDAFYAHIEQGGSPALFGALYQQLKAEGKHTAAEELKDRGGGVLDWVRDRIDDAIDLAGRVAGSVAGGVVDLVRNGVGLAVDIARGTVDVVGDVAEGAQQAIAFAVENGLKLGGRLLDFAIDAYRGRLDDSLKVTDHIEALGPGDSWQFEASAEVSALFGAEAAKGITVERNADGGYDVSGYTQAGADIKYVEGLEAGAGGKVTFHVDTAEEAAQVALMFASAPKPGELGFLKDHLKSIEFTGSVALESELAKLGVGDVQAALEGEAGRSTGYRIEFEDGKPSALVRVDTFYAEGSAAGDARLESRQLAQVRALAEQAGIDLPDEYALNVDLQVQVETRIPLSGSVDAVKDLLAGRPGDALKGAAGQVTQSVTIRGSVEAAGDDDVFHGKAFELKAENLDLRDAAALVRATLAGDPGALHDLDADFSGWWADTTRHDESDLDLNVVINGVGFGVETTVGSTDVDWEHRRRFG